MTESLLPWISAAISLAGTLIGYGMMKEKVLRLEKDLDETRKNAVSMQHFDAVIRPIKDTIKEVRDDVKKLLNSSNNNYHHNK